MTTFLENSLMRARDTCILILGIVTSVGSWASAYAADCGNSFNLRNAITPSPVSVGKHTVDPSLRRLVLNIAKSYACQSFVNHYAESSGLPNDIVKSVTATTETVSILSFENKSNANVCGVINYRVARAVDVPSLNKQQSDVHLELSSLVLKDFMQTNIAGEAEDWAVSYLPAGVQFPRPTGERFDAMMQSYSAGIAAKYTALITQRNWTTAESDVLLSSIQCSSLLPEASGPDMKMLANYPSALRDFEGFARDLDTQVKQ